MDIKSYDEGWNQAIERAIEIVKNSLAFDYAEEQLKKEFRE